MESPIPVWEEPLPGYSNGASGSSQQDSNLRTGTVSIVYIVSDRGRVKIVEMQVDPIEFSDMQRMVDREIRRRVFRPAMVDGIPVDATGQTFRHEFFYLESERKELQKEQAQQDVPAE